MSTKKAEFKRQLFVTSLNAGLDLSAKEILKVSAKTCKAVQGGPVEELARNVDNTIQIFVTDKGDGSLMRFYQMASRIIELIIQDRLPKFLSIDGHDKIKKLGTAYGYMAGTAVLTTCTNVFIQQGHERLASREDLDQKAKQICLQYLNDAFTVILMELTKNLDSKYALSKRERLVFAKILSSNEWLPVAPSETNVNNESEQVKE